MARTRGQLLAENRTLRARIRQLERGKTRRADHAARFQALTEASLLMNAPLSLDDTVRVVTEEARRVIGAEAAATSLRVDGTGSPALHVRSRSRRGTGRPDGPCVRLAAPLTGRDGRRLGRIRLSRVGRPFTDDDHAALVQLAQLASLAVENGRLHEAARARVRGQAALLEVGRAVTRALDLCEVVRTVLEAADHLVPGCAAELWEVVPGTDELRALETRGFGQAPPGPLRLGEGLVGVAGATGRPVTSPDVREDPRFVQRAWAAAEGLVSGVCLPLRHAGTLFGALGLFTRSPHRFTTEEVDRLEAFGNQAAAAIANARLYAEATRRQREAEELARIARSLTERLDIHAVGERILESVSALFGVRSAGLRLVQADGSLLSVAQEGPAAREHFPPGHVMPAGTGMMGRAVAEGRPVWTPDVVAEPDVVLSADLRDWFVASGIRAVLAVPLRVEARVIGVLVVSDQQARSFSPSEVALLQTFGDQAALALENARLYAESERRRRAAEALAEVGRALARSLDLEAVGQQIADGVSALLGTRSALLWRLEAESGPVVALAVSGPIERDFQRRAVVPLGFGAIGRAVRDRQPVASPDVFADARLAFAREVRERFADTADRAVLAVPLMLQGRVTGVLTARDWTGRVFGPAEVTLAQAFADQAALALENARLFEAVERRRHEAEALEEVGRLLAQSLDTDVVVGRILHSAHRLLGTVAATLYRLEPDSGELVALAASGDVGPEPDRAFAYPRGTGVVGRAVEEGRPVASADVVMDPRLTHSPEVVARLERAGFRAALAVPLVVKDRVIGVLGTGDRAGRVFEDEDVRLFQAFADRAAVALDNARLYQETERRRREAEVMAEVARVVNGSLELDTVLRGVAEAARELCGSDLAEIGLREPGADTLIFRHRSGTWAERPVPLRIEAGKGASGLVLSTGRSFRTDDYAADPRITKDYLDVARAEGMVASLAIPITIGGRVEGTLNVDNRSARPFTDRDEEVLLRLAEHAAVAIRNAQAFAREQAARAAAEESEQRFRDLVESLDAVVWEADAATGRFAFVSRRAEAILGYSVGQWLTDPAFWIGLVHPEDREQALALRQAGTAEGLDHEFEYRAIGADGRVVWLHDVVRVVRDAEGRPGQLRGVTVDVTGRRRADEVLRRSEARFRIAAECASDLIYESDIPTGRVEYFGPVDALLGYAPGEFPRTRGDWEAVIHPDDRARVMAEVDRALGLGEAVDIEYRVLCGNGTLRYWTDRGRLLSDESGTPSKWIGAVTDVTERRQAQEALRDSEARYRSVIAALAEGVVLHDAEGAIRACNASAERILGLSADQMTGRTSHDPRWRAIHEDGSPFPGEEHPAMVTLRTGRPCANVVLGLPQSGGDLTWISINTQPLQREGEARPYAVVASFTDITARKQAERERTELLDRLITAQEEERRRVSRELHDQMSQDLTALLLRLKAFEQPYAGPADRHARELQELVKQLMQRVNRLAWELRPTALDDWGLETALRRYADEWSRRAGVPVDFHSNGLEDRRVPADVATALYRIAQEALTNVFRHAAASRASVLLEARPDHVQMIVDDDGRGFEVGPRAGAGLSPRRLGLLGMQERVWLVGGTLTIESAPGAGTTVFVSIPLPEGQATP